VSRARQFSSMIVLVGRIASASVFEPKYAAIIQNKDELTIPLELSTIPTPKEFKDAIESLSPEQQSFPKAFRAMQLESTLFGILVIQIKPQLERVLNLPDDSLTKEIKLTQDLMQLFIKYQIPTDLLSFDAAAGSDGVLVAPTQTQALEAVKSHVNAIQAMIQQSQNEEIQQRQQEQLYSNPFGQMHQPQMAMDCFSAPMASSFAFSASPPPMACASACSFGGGAMLKMSAPALQAQAAPQGLFSFSPASTPPQQAQPRQEQPQQQQQPQQHHAGGSASSGAAAGTRDYTQVPKEMDAQFEKLDTDSCLRPTIISPGDTWTKKAQKALLATPTTSTLNSHSQKTEKDAAFDLLDALTKSGALSIEHASLHVVVAATHCFDKTVTETVVQEGINPIDKVERSTLIMATTVHQESASMLINENQQARVNSTSPMLFLTDAAQPERSLLDA
jgi:hypothetical protein